MKILRDDNGMLAAREGKAPGYYKIIKPAITGSAPASGGGVLLIDTDHPAWAEGEKHLAQRQSRPTVRDDLAKRLILKATGLDRCSTCGEFARFVASIPPDQRGARTEEIAHRLRLELRRLADKAEKEVEAAEERAEKLAVAVARMDEQIAIEVVKAAVDLAGHKAGVSR